MNKEISKHLPTLCSWLNRLKGIWISESIGELVYTAYANDHDSNHMRAVAKRIAVHLNWAAVFILKDEDDKELNIIISKKFKDIAQQIEDYKEEDIHTHIRELLIVGHIYPEKHSYALFIDAIPCDEIIPYITTIISQLHEHETLRCARILKRVLLLRISNTGDYAKARKSKETVKKINGFVSKLQEYIDAMMRAIKAEMNSVLEENMCGEIYEAHVRDIIGEYL